MKVFVACEFSQTVCIEFRKRGHEAFSCDLLPCEGGHPEWHIQDDCLRHLNDGWDLMIAHPPCTYFAVAGLQYLKTKPGRLNKQKKSAEFIKNLWNADINKICLENPIGQLPKYIGEYSQIIRMWQFGYPEANKPTCLWLKNLPLLKPSNVVSPIKSRKYPNGKVLSQWRAKTSGSKNRSITFKNVAKAMAEQWG